MNERTPTSRKTALENMVIARDVLARRGIAMFLSYGTLLGALRERDFIPHDDDVDVHIFERDKEAFLAAFPELESRGLKLLKQAAATRRYAFVRGGEQIDFFLARETRKGGRRRAWDLEGRVSIPARHLDQLESIDFLGENFSVPSDPYRVLRILYGRTWNVPIANRPSRVGFGVRFRNLVTHPEKAFFYLHRFITKHLQWRALAKRARRDLRDRNKRGIHA